MNIIRRNPTALSPYRPRSFDEQFGNLVERFFDDMLLPFGRTDEQLSPRLNISETEQAFEVLAELPGVNKDDVKVAIDHQRVTIEAENKHESEQRQGANVLYSERSASKYLRSFTLPADVDEASAQARMENGILTLTLPKKQGTTATRIAIQ